MWTVTCFTKMEPSNWHTPLSALSPIRTLNGMNIDLAQALRRAVRNLSRYMAELEELIEGYRTFVSNALLATQVDLATRRKLLKKTQKIIGPPPDPTNS